MAIEFQAWPKTPRLKRNSIITEKIDGTNVAVIVIPLKDVLPEEGIFSSTQNAVEYAVWWDQNILAYVGNHKEHFVVAAQSRNRLIRPGKDTDNYGFARWVADNAGELVRILGEGRHYGEWWGKGIQRGYGLGHKKLSLFNTHRWKDLHAVDSPLLREDQLDVVPVLSNHTHSDEEIERVLTDLRGNGSKAAPGFMNPEGIIVYHSQSKQNYKVLLENDEISKTEAGVA